MTAPRTGGGAALQVEALVALIRDQSQAEVAEIVAQGRERAERIAAAADAEAEEIRAAARRNGEDVGGRHAAKLLATAEAESRRLWLSEREALVQEVLGRARRELARFPTLPGASAALADLIGEGLSALPAGAVRVCLPEGYEPLLGETVREKLARGRSALRFETGSVPGGGVVLESEDGRLRFDNSFAARIRRRAERLRHLAAAALLDEGAGSE